MTTGPDYLRIGDTERDAMAESLHEHFVQGRLNREELDERLTAALTAKTAGDLREIDQDLPRPPAAYAPDTTPGQRGGPPWAAHHRLARRGDLPLGHHRHGPRPLRLLLAAALLVVIATAAGTGWMVFAVVRVFFVVWLVMAVVGLVQGRRWRRMNRPHR
jgi:Flp pilus assembly protein TadB